MREIREALRELRRTYAPQPIGSLLDLPSVREAHLALQQGKTVSMDLALMTGIDDPALDGSEGDDRAKVHQSELEKARKAAIRGGEPKKPIVVVY